ncbi:hypothetical protein F7R05_23655 [Pseudomonas koreensis]|nr:hypothetical protein F7R05_23655 [Pseudomonas koreensis]
MISRCSRTDAIASRLAPTGDCMPNVGASLLAKRPDQSPQKPPGFITATPRHATTLVDTD